MLLLDASLMAHPPLAQPISQPSAKQWLAGTGEGSAHSLARHSAAHAYETLRDRTLHTPSAPSTQTHRRNYSECDVTGFRLREPLPMTPKSDDLLPKAAESKPSAASPLLSSSRTADARLGIRALKRKLSSAVSSSGESMICRRSSRDRVTIDDTLCQQYHTCSKTRKRGFVSQ